MKSVFMTRMISGVMLTHSSGDTAEEYQRDTGYQGRPQEEGATQGGGGEAEGEARRNSGQRTHQAEDSCR